MNDSITGPELYPVCSAIPPVATIGYNPKLSC